MGGGGNGEPGGVCGGRGRWTWGGVGVPGGAGGSGSGGGGGLGWGSRTGGGGSEKSDGARGGRRRWTWGGGGARGGARGSRCGGSGVPGGRGGALAWPVEARWRCGECGRQGRVCHPGGERERRRLQDQASLLESGQSGGVGGTWRASRGAAWYWGGGGGGPPSSMDLPCRGVVAAAAGGMGRVTVPGGVWSGGPPRRGRGGRGDTVAGTGRVAPGGRWGMRVERSVTAIPYAGAVRARGVVARWGRVVGSGSGGGGVGDGAGGTAGGGGAGSGGVGDAGMALGPLVGIPVPLVGPGEWAS